MRGRVFRFLTDYRCSLHWKPLHVNVRAMNLNLSAETEAWLRAQVQNGHFASYEDAIEYTVRLASLRETLLDSIADPRRYAVDGVRANLRAHFDARRTESSKL
jgi:Arc/MetJ-type ribon-helix-helix transcriptional regulator